MQKLNLERLHSLLSYDASSGEFTWKVGRQGAARDGSAGGVNPRGYVRICVDGRIYPAHRLAWLYMHGEWPAGVIDHINGVKHDNRIDNLRDASLSVNSQNLRDATSKNASSSLLGVSFIARLGKYRAQIKAGGKSRHLGVYLTEEAAHAAYVAEKRRVHDGCTI